MKKKWLIIVIFMFLYWCFFGYLSAQNSLRELYKKGEITLVPVPSYGKGVNWSKLFSDYNKEAYRNSVGKSKKMAIADDGSVYVSNSSSWNVYKFNPEGQFVKAFGQKGQKNGFFYRRPEIYDILPNFMSLIKGWHGGIYLFDREGIFQKSIKFDYMPYDCVALTNDIIAVSGSVIYSDRRMKYRVAIINLKTGKEKEIISTFRDMKKNVATVDYKGGMISCGFPFNRIDSFIRPIENGKFIAGFSNSSILSMFSAEGKLLKTIKMQIEQVPITKEDRESYLVSLKKSVEKKAVSQKMLEAVKNTKYFFNSFMPYYYYMMVDSDNNILVFPFGKAESGRWFQVYSHEGEFICETKLNIKDYQIILNPRAKSMAFFNGSIYGLFEKKGVKGIPLRLVKMNVK